MNLFRIVLCLLISITLSNGNLLFKKDGNTVIDITNSGDISFTGYYQEEQAFGTTSDDLKITEQSSPLVWTTNNNTLIKKRMFFNANFPNNGLVIKESGNIYTEIDIDGNMYAKADQTGALADPKINGGYTYSTKYYASTGTQYISRYQNPSSDYAISRRPDISDFYNSINSTWGFGGSSVPINGIAKIPNGSGKFPLAIFVHGNHSQFDFSDEGYIYLCELFASHGIIAATMDANFLNAGSSENDARAILHLEHVKQFKIWNEQSGHPLYGKVDMDKILLVGHSRGGEGAGHASYFNTLASIVPNSGDQAVPLDGSQGLGPYDFNLNICAIAPTNTQYTPVTGPTKIKDNYYILHGSRDGDVSNFQGFKTYDRAHPINLVNPAESANGFKSLLWIYGANHNYFNSTWNSEGSPTISRTEQQNVAKVMIGSMAYGLLLNKSGYLNSLKNHLFASTWLPATEYVSEYQDEERLFINHYEEDQDMTTLSPPVTGNNDWDLALSDEISFNSNSTADLYQETNGLRIKWNSSGDYYMMDNIEFPNGLGPESFQNLSLRVGQSVESENPDGGIQNYTIIIRDNYSSSASFEVSDFVPLLYPDDGVSSVKTVMQTLRIPISNIRSQGVDISSLASITFQFNKTAAGVVYIDEIQLTN